MNDKCHVCQSTKITHYRQIRKDGVTVVTARCENGHIPQKGKPFYPVYLFKVDKLPLLGGDEIPSKPVQQLTMLEQNPVKKYPPMPKPKYTGVNFPYPVEDE